MEGKATTICTKTGETGSKKSFSGEYPASSKQALNCDQTLLMFEVS
jgi:hypothetical protein